MVKNLHANAGDMRRGFNPWVGKEPRDSLEEGMAIDSSFLS